MDFFDTNVLVYTVDLAEPRKMEVARDTIDLSLADGGFTISTQVMQEFYNAVTRRGFLAHRAAVHHMRQFRHERVVSTTPELLWGAFEVKERYGFSIWDALIVQAAIEAGCTRLFTEDLQHGQRIGTLEVVDPFQAAPAVHEPRAAYRVKPARRRSPSP